MLASYLEIVSNCIDAGTPPDPFTFVPHVPVEKLSDELQRTRALKLLGQVCEKDVDDIDEAVKARQAEWEASLPLWLTEMREEVWEETVP